MKNPKTHDALFNRQFIAGPNEMEPIPKYSLDNPIVFSDNGKTGAVNAA